MSESKPVKVSPGAYAALSYKMRQWTGWSKGVLTLGETGTDSPYAACWHDPKFEIIVNPETLLLNPNRVLNTVTPFRLRQEAVLTGALLHEAGHARHSHWQPGRYGNADVAVHGAMYTTSHPLTGAPVPAKVSDLVLEFAKTVEEARVEGLIAAESTEIGAHGLSWTLRCSALRVLPFTEVSMDPAQAVLDVLCGWVLRAGRALATSHHFIATGRAYPIPAWVGEYNTLLNKVVSDHIIANKLVASNGEASDGDPWGDDPSAQPEITNVMSTLYEMLVEGEEASKPGSTFMVDKARKVLDLLFPASEQENLEASSGCQEDQGEDESDEEGDSGDESPSEAGDGGEGDESGEDGEGDTEPEDEGSGDDSGAGDSGSDESDSDGDYSPDAEAQAKQAKTQAAVDAAESKAAKQSADEQADEIAEPSEGPDPSQGQAPGQADQSDQDSEAEKQQAPQRGAGNQRGRGVRNLTYRQPVKAEREVKKGAESFLRNLIDPSEKGKLQVTDAPTASVDGAALSAWKAGGQNTAPLFFRRIKRTEQPAPPVKIAILVDVSASMDVLQAPSALLSWALSAACLDLRNFAGRGVQVESTLIHWGSSARVIQPNGKPMPGIHMDDCMESTIAMDEALDLVAQELPGFFDPMVKDENRLLVQFTDWELGWGTLTEVTSKINKALTNGVNMLSVVPQNYSWRSTSLDPVLASIRQPKGRSALLKYNPDRPGEVWTAAAEVLSGADTNYGF